MHADRSRCLLVDTAGRLHIDDQLMQELQELKEQLSPAEILFVADAMTGQDAVNRPMSSQTAGDHRRNPDQDGCDARGGAALSIRSITISRSNSSASARNRRTGAVLSGARGPADSGHGRHAFAHREGGRKTSTRSRPRRCSASCWTTNSLSTIFAISYARSAS